MRSTLFLLLAVGVAFAIKCKVGTYIEGVGTTVDTDCSLGEYVSLNYTKCKWFSKDIAGVNNTYHGCGSCDPDDDDDCWDCSTDLCNGASTLSATFLPFAVFTAIFYYVY